MGVWGFRLFQNDKDLDTIEDIAAELGVESLYFPDCPRLVKEELERDGKLDRKLAEVGGQGLAHEFGLLVAAAMAVGPKIGQAYLSTLSAWLAISNAGFYDEGKATLVDALKIYDPNEGEPLVVAGMGLNMYAALKAEHTKIERARQGLTGPPPPAFFIGSSMGHMGARTKR